MSSIAYAMLKAHEDEALADQIEWHKHVSGITDPQRLKDFEAGFRRGWLKAVSDLKLHTGLRVVEIGADPKPVELAPALPKPIPVVSHSDDLEMPAFLKRSS